MAEFLGGSASTSWRSFVLRVQAGCSLFSIKQSLWVDQVRRCPAACTSPSPPPSHTASRVARVTCDATYRDVCGCLCVPACVYVGVCVGVWVCRRTSCVRC
jgi:hypothetical protein